MFTGIVEATAHIESISSNGENKTFTLSSSVANEFKPDQSVSHNGICLTVEEVNNERYTVTAISETLRKTNAGRWQMNDVVNLERSMKINDRLDGHIVQGHIDTTAACTAREEQQGSVIMRFRFPSAFAALVVEKGSICLNGISLTAFDVSETEFAVAVIPYTLTHTNISAVEPGAIVNVEFDIMGKYVQRLITLSSIKSK